MNILPQEMSASLYQCPCGYVVRFPEKAIWLARERSYTKKQWLSDDASSEKHIAVFQDGQMTAMLCPAAARQTGRAWKIGRRLAAAAVVAGISTVLLLLSLLRK